MYYVYEHYRKSDGIVFYVGIGNNNNKIYTRSKSTAKRNPHWHAVVNKYGFVSKIVFESNDRGEICDKEIELISKYGRSDLGTGNLVNKTSGGEKTFNISDSSIKAGILTKRENGTYKKIAEIARTRMLNANPWKGKTHGGLNNKKIYQYDIKSGIFVASWDSIKKAISHLGCNPKTIKWVLNGKRKSGLGYYWSYVYLGDLIPNINNKWENGASKIIIEFDIDGNIINEWPSISKASVDFSCSSWMMSYYLKLNKNINDRIIRYKTII